MIIDCFPFFDELDVLEIRLNELKDVVDVFVLVESHKTFSGNTKPLWFNENKDRFKDFNIIHEIYDDAEILAPMERERRQKQKSLDIAYDCYKQGDVIIQGDVDEIPRAFTLKNNLEEDWKAILFSLDLYYYYLNCWAVTDKIFKNSWLLRPSKRVTYNPKQNNKPEYICARSGWHFSYLGDIQAKIKAWGHSDRYDKPPYNTTEHIQKCKETGTDLFMRTGKQRLKFEILNDLDYLPHYVLNNIDKFDKWIKH